VRAADAKPVEALIKDLESTDDNARQAAAAALAELGPKAEPAVPALLNALKSKNEFLRLNATLALGKVGKGAVAKVADALQDKDDDVRYYAIWALGLIGPGAKDAVPADPPRLPP